MDARALTSKAETAFQTGDVGNGLVLGDRTEPMSALGQKRTFTHLRPMSALPPKADIRTWPELRATAPAAWRYSPRSAARLIRVSNVRFTPNSGHWLNGSGCPLCAKSRHSALRHRPALFDHFVGASEQRGRYGEPKSLGSGQIDDEV